MRVQTIELKPGDVVATATVFRDFVDPSQSTSGVPRTVEDIAVQPADRKTDSNRVVFFADGTLSHCRQGAYWYLIKEA